MGATIRGKPYTTMLSLNNGIPGRNNKFIGFGNIQDVIHNLKQHEDCRPEIPEMSAFDQLKMMSPGIKIDPKEINKVIINQNHLS